LLWKSAAERAAVARRNIAIGLGTEVPLPFRKKVSVRWTQALSHGFSNLQHQKVPIVLLCHYLTS
jgi:hypothetical protein